jgi:ABC-type branched-subunit amino acid transport system substrate-binding protein
MRSHLIVIGVLAAGLAAGGAIAQSKYSPGATDAEIKIGITVPLSGPASSYGVACAAHEAFFKMINEEQGGVGGRKLKLICADDAFSPPKTVEQTRRLVESDEVVVVYNSLGTASNTAVRPYLASRKVPQLLLNSGASKWSDPKDNPWATASIPHYFTEATIFARYIMTNAPNAKVGLLQQNDDYGKDYLSGLKIGFGDQADKYLKAVQTYEITDPTVDSQILLLKNAGVDTIVLGALAKHAAQAIRKIGELGWKPTILLSWSSTAIDAVLTPAGLDNSLGIISTTVIKHPGDAAWANDDAVVKYKAFMTKYLPSAQVENISNVFAYATDWILLDILKRAGNDLTRDNIRNLAQNIDIAPPMYMPGVRFVTTPSDLDPIKKFQLIRFDGQKWKPIGDPISSAGDRQ